ncbi:MAG: FAD-dependent oxidoreductase [Gaiellaceae bacterium]
MNVTETDVLIVGAGPAGLSAGLFLSEYGVPNVLVERYRSLSHTPRAHITNQRAVEIMRDMGLEHEIIAKATPQDLMGNQVFCTSLAGEELARLRVWGTHPSRRADYELASPSSMCDLPQTLLEPILLEAAAARGTEVRFNTEYLSLEQDGDGVTATVRHRPSDAVSQIRAKYLLGADGSRSKVADDIGLPLEGQMGVAGSMNILIRADLTHLVEHRPSVLYWILQPGSTIGGVGMGVVRMVRPWNEWLLIWGYDINEPAPQVDDDEARRIAHRLIGDDSIDVQVEDISLWTNNRAYMTRYSSGRVFCMGDACHRHPPNNGLGANTSIQDSYNLAWKLAHVLRGQAGPSLLDTYDDERVPVGGQIVERANKSIAEFGAIFEAFGLTDPTDAEQMRANMAARKDDTPQATAQREQLRRAMELKNYEFNAHGVEFNQRYRSAAVVRDGTEEPVYERDPELYYHPTTWPGARLPHCWVEHRGRKVSTIDLAGHGRFTLLTGIGGESWAQAAATVSARMGVSIGAFVVGPGREVLDLYYDWASLSEVSERGCVLVRPDLHVAWRSHDLAADPTVALARVLDAILGRGTDEDRGLARRKMDTATALS